MPSRTESFVTGTVPAPDNRWADVGAALAAGLNKAYDFKIAQAAKKQEQEADMDKITMHAILQNFGPSEEGDKNAFPVKFGGKTIYMSPKKAATGQTVEDINKILLDVAKQAEEQILTDIDNGIIYKTEQEVENKRREYFRNMLSNMVNPLTGRFFTEGEMPSKHQTDSYFYQVKKAQAQPGQFVAKKPGQDWQIYDLKDYSRLDKEAKGQLMVNPADIPSEYNPSKSNMDMGTTAARMIKSAVVPAAQFTAGYPAWLGTNYLNFLSELTGVSPLSNPGPRERGQKFFETFKPSQVPSPAPASTPGLQYSPEEFGRFLGGT